MYCTQKAKAPKDKMKKSFGLKEIIRFKTEEKTPLVREKGKYSNKSAMGIANPGLETENNKLI